MNILGYIIAIAVVIALDIYIFQLVKSITDKSSARVQKVASYIFWGFTGITIIAIVVAGQLDPFIHRFWRTMLGSFIFINVFSKLISGVFLLVDDLVRGTQWIILKLGKGKEDKVDLSRKKFLTKTAIGAGAIPFATMGFGIATGAYNYQVRSKTLYFKDLPKSFDGIKVAQLSDIHSGSFYNKTAVKGGIDLLLGEKPDVVFFTGDLVNDQSKEVEDYVPIFEKVRAPLGVFSTMGNHDYGDYRSWSSMSAKKQDIKNLHKAHELMGWDLLLNENRKIKVDGDEISILGVENWGKGRFSKYGNLQQTHIGTEDTAFKILLSHDPSHWDAEVVPDYKDIDLTLSGHTHGFQFGIEIGDFRWSPSKYMYKQWADLYQKGNQYIYVNRGFGFIGYPGRVGILPEVTILELKRA